MKNTILRLKNCFGFLVSSVDYIIFGLVVSFLIFDIIRNTLFLLDNLSIFSYNDSILHMSNPGSGNSGSGNPWPSVYTSGNYPNNPASNPSSYSTQVSIIHDDGSWSNAIRSLFVYGTGGLRMWLNVTRGGTPGGRAVVFVSTIAADSVTRVLQNTINDPNYVREHITNWQTVWDSHSPDTLKVKVDSATESRINSALPSDGQNSTPNNLGGVHSSAGYTPGSGSGAAPGSGSNNGITNNFIGDNNSDIESFSNSIIQTIIENIKNIFEPVQVSYSNEILSNQIHDISILLFILTIFILILFLSLLFNIFLFIFSDRLMNYFTNKYIKWYISFNKKIIGIELIMLSGWILYLMYMVSYGVHFIATHPIIF